MAGSWLSQFWHSIVNGAVASPPVQHADGTTNPVHAVVDNFNAAGAALGGTLTNVAQTEVGAIVTKYAGPAGGVLEQMLLTALLETVQAKLTPTVEAAPQQQSATHLIPLQPT